MLIKGGPQIHTSSRRDEGNHATYFIIPLITSIFIVQVYGKLISLEQPKVQVHKNTFTLRETCTTQKYNTKKLKKKRKH